jgi:hypothetical protein
MRIADKEVWALLNFGEVAALGYGIIATPISCDLKNNFKKLKFIYIYVL